MLEVEKYGENCYMIKNGDYEIIVEEIKVTEDDLRRMKNQCQTAIEAGQLTKEAQRIADEGIQIQNRTQGAMLFKRRGREGRYIFTAYRQSGDVRSSLFYKLAKFLDAPQDLYSKKSRVKRAFRQLCKELLS